MDNTAPGGRPMHQVNLNDVAAQIAAEEGLLESVSVAQVKELLGILGRR